MAEQPLENPVPKPVKRERSADRDSVIMTPELKYKVAKSDLMSPADRHEERRRDARLYEMDRDRRKVRKVYCFQLVLERSRFNDQFCDLMC